MSQLDAHAGISDMLGAWALDGCSLVQVVDTLMEETRTGTDGQLGARPFGAAAQRH